MIDDKGTCDVCGEEFNADRPHGHEQKKTEKPPGEASGEGANDESEEKSYT